MPDYLDYPTRNDEEQPPTPERIIDRIINGRLRPLAAATRPTPPAE